MDSMERRPCWHTVKASKLVIRKSPRARLHPCVVYFHHTSMWRYTCSWIDWPSGGPFRYETLSSTRRITHSGTEGFHINENVQEVNVFKDYYYGSTPLANLLIIH